MVMNYRHGATICKRLVGKTVLMTAYRAWYFFTAQSAVLLSHVVCPSVRLSVCETVTLVDHDHIG